MKIVGIFKEFIRDLRAQKLRTVLTIFGIIWGTVAIIVLLAFGNGFQRATMKTMKGIGESIILLFPGRTARPFMGYGVNRWIRFREDDAYLLEKQIPKIMQISPEYSTWRATLRVGTNRRNPNVTGCIPVYAEIRNIIPAEGSRFLNEMDMKNNRRVVFLGNELAAYLFEGEDPVGKYVYVGSNLFRVIGVMQTKEQDSSYNSRDQDRAFIPTSTFNAIFGHRYINNIVIKPESPMDSPGIIDEIYTVMGNKYKFDPEDREALSIWDTSEFQKMILYVFLGLNIFMGIIGSFTLTVGGVGVANIMYVVVQERTREIGIKRSVGAKKHHIMTQFFVETFFIISLGAIIGILISMVLIFLITLLPIDEFVGTPSISWWVAAVALFLLGAIGFIAGYFPARRAAGLNVVDCLHQ
jgi:putative ABC transport system permease protein